MGLLQGSLWGHFYSFLSPPTCWWDSGDVQVCGCVSVHLPWLSCGRCFSSVFLECLQFHVPHCTHTITLALQFTEVVPQRPIQLPPAPCSDPALGDHSIPGSHHMVCLHWRWLLCGPHSLVKCCQCNQFHLGHQPGLHHCIKHPVDHCLTGLHGQCHSGLGVPYSV